MNVQQAWSQTAELFHAFRSTLAVAKRSDAFLAIINRDPTPLDSLADYNFKGEIGAFFTRLDPLLTDG